MKMIGGLNDAWVKSNDEELYRLLQEVINHFYTREKVKLAHTGLSFGGDHSRCTY